MAKYKLTTEFKMWCGIKLYQIEALESFSNVSKGDKGGWIEKEENLSRVSGDAWVYGNAQVSAKFSFTKGWFIGGDDTGKITDITDKTGSTYWRNQYVLGDYEITPLEEKKELDLSGQEVEVKVGGKTYKAKII